MEGHKNVFQANGIRKQTGVACLIAEKIYFNPNLVRRNKGHFIHTH
jgi:predicted SprT family Zn-dependent metalloprotease